MDVVNVEFVLHEKLIDNISKFEMSNDFDVRNPKNILNHNIVVNGYRCLHITFLESNTII